MDSDRDTEGLLAQSGEIEERLTSYRVWQRRAHRYLFIRLPIVGAFLYVSAELQLFWAAVVVMLVAGGGWYLLTGDEIRRLSKERDAVFLEKNESGKEGDVP